MSLTSRMQRCTPLKFKTHLLASVYNYSTGSLREIDTKLETVPRGTGYWSSFNGTTATVFGASGCLGCPIVNRLVNRGTQVVIPYRGDPYMVNESRACGDLGQMLFTKFHLEDDDSIRRAMKYSDVVINCIGREFNTLNFTIERCNVVGARRIARIAREMGVKKLIHISSLGASPNPREIHVKGGSRLLKSKWHGEVAVREEFPDAIIVRPSQCFGEMDKFFRLYGAKRSYIWGVYFLWKLGMETEKQPIYIPDVVSGIHELVTRHIDDVKGKTYQFVGPRRYVLGELVRFIMDLMWKVEEREFYIKDSRESIFFHIYREFFDKAYLNFPNSKNSLTWEHFELEHTNDELDPNLPTIKDLGVKLTPFESVAPQFLFLYREEPLYPADPFEVTVPLPRVLSELK